MAEERAPPPPLRPPSLIGASVYHQGRRVADIGIDQGRECTALYVNFRRNDWL